MTRQRLTVDSSAVILLSALTGIAPAELVAAYNRRQRALRLRTALAVLAHIVVALLAIGAGYGLLLAIIAGHDAVVGR